MGYSGGQGQAAPQYSATGGGQGYSNQQGGGRSPTGYGHSQQGSGYSSHSQAQSHQGQAPGYQQSQATSYGHQSQPSYGQAPSYIERARSRSRSVGRAQALPQAQSSQAPLTTAQVTEDGTPILFYVQALYPYTATIPDEFDFTAGDIIAVTSTPEDGWWGGELLDEERRGRGGWVFPSNFVRLLE
ncbi:hypothetical protein C8J56DRAFT_248686 [Mycena floridula]|nr:hypothetical protein C8J56DRAFT_248686 [Mycena floridula]